MRETSNEQEFDSRFDRAFQPGFDEGPVDTGDLDRLGFGPGAGPAAGIDDRAGDDTARPGRAHPLIDRFVIALWVVGGFFVVAGVLASFAVSSFYNNGVFSTGAPDVVFITILSQLTQWMPAIGLATLVGTLFLLASRSDRRA